MTTVTIRQRVYNRKRTGRVVRYHLTAYEKNPYRKQHLGSFKTEAGASSYRDKWLKANADSTDQVESQYTVSDVLQMRWT